MTAEIAILNTSGIALAADSAVTIGEQKVYNSANKLFALSKYQPVGIMVYDSADLMDIPWEIIVKEYRSKLGVRTFPTLAEYAEHFWNYLRTDKHIIPVSNKDSYLTVQAANLLQYLFAQLKEKVTIRIEEAQETTLQESYEIFLTTLSDLESRVSATNYLDGFAEADADDIFRQHKDTLEDLTRRQFGELFSLFSDKDKQTIYRIIANLFVRDLFLLRQSGVVIAGFGTSEMFPKIASYIAEGVVGDRVKKKFLDGKSNIQNKDFFTTIIPFAQDEMVWTFIDGVDPQVATFASKYLTEALARYSGSLDFAAMGITGQALDAIKGQLINDGTKVLEQFQRDLWEFQQFNNRQPILDMVGVLPKDELAAMAESLVNLTVFKRKVSKTVETVGGPIDVAVISKGDGFIWVKRKHYFKAELNQHFFANYFQPVDNDDQ